MKYYKLTLLSLLLISAVNNFSQTRLDDRIYQYSSKQGFLEKKYDGDLLISQAKGFGDFGLGTINGVDGEVIVHENIFYRVDYEGKVNELSSTAKTPFVVLKNFEADTSFSFSKITTLTELKNILDSLSANQPYAVKVTGSFNKIKSRSVKKVSKPYPTLTEIVVNQNVFEFENTDAVLIGFWFPEYLDGVNFPGYHLHCLIEGNKGGGHLLDCETNNIKVEVDFSGGLIMDY